jgi:hypothetical protein
MYVNRESMPKEFHRKGIHLSPKMRDSSAKSSATISTVSSSMSDYDIEEIDATAATLTPHENNGLTCNRNVTFCNTRRSCIIDNDFDSESVVSHVSSLSGHMPTSTTASSDVETIRLPLHISSVSQDDSDDDDLSFAPLDDDDEDSSFVCLDDGFETIHDTQDENGNQQECPSDEESNGNYGNSTYQRLDRAHTTSFMKDVNNVNEENFIQQKTLPGLNNSYKVVCVSFMEYNVATSVACKVLDESLRMLRPGGLLYVIDKGGCTVKKHPTMRQWLSRVRDPTVKHLVYEIETRAILQANGFVHRKLDENNDATTENTDDGDWEDEEIVRWIGIKQ